MLREPVPVNNCFLHVESLAYGGEAVGHLDSGKVCFVPGLLPGEDAEIRIIQDKKSFSRGEVVRIITPAPERIVPDCPVFPACPGCAYSHCDYSTELFWKQRQFADFLQRCGFDGAGKTVPPFGAPERYGYRNKLTLHCANGTFSMVGRDNESLIPITSCGLACARINEALKDLKLPADSDSVTLRCTDADGVIAFPGRRAPEKSNWLTEHIPGVGKLKVAPDGFFQTNPAVAAELVRRAVAEIEGSGFEKLAELYCGVGVFSVAAALKIPKLRCSGVELSSAAVKAAKWNAAHHGVDSRCRFFAGDAGKLISAAGIDRNCCLLVDPPRAGLSRQTIENIIAAGPGKIIYISCAADTLQRDLRIFREHHWQLENAGILDMFPATAHFEALVTLIKE